MKFLLFESEDKAKQELDIGKPRLILAGGKEICLVHTHNGIHAFQNLCSHMGARLNEGNTNFLGEIICPLHTYRFNMKTGDESENRCNALKVYPIEYLPEGVFIEVD